jgi:UDP-N-acetylglucosamine enolpyruvyl transferase
VRKSADTRSRSQLDNVPHLQDVNTMTRLIRNMGVSMSSGPRTIP